MNSTPHGLIHSESLFSSAITMSLPNLQRLVNVGSDGESAGLATPLLGLRVNHIFLHWDGEELALAEVGLHRSRCVSSSCVRLGYMVGNSFDFQLSSLVRPLRHLGVDPYLVFSARF